MVGIKVVNDVNVVDVVYDTKICLYCKCSSACCVAVGCIVLKFVVVDVVVMA